MSIAVIGAGMAGLAAARALAADGQPARIFDKGRGPGGRMAHRRARLHAEEVSFDHGAQYFTARDERFRAVVDRWTRAGVVDVWSPQRAAGRPEETWYVGRPGMNAMLRDMASRCDVSWSARVTGILGAAQDWWLQMEDGLEEGPFRQLVVALPAEQAAELLASQAPGLAAAARSVRTLPCWSVMLAFGAPTGVPLDVYERGNASGPVAWAARNSSKPGRGSAETWILQAGADWSAANIEAAPETVADVLARDFCASIGAPEPELSLAHRWRFARVHTPLGEPCLIDRPLGIATCGDWHLGPRVEAAWLSGHALGEKLLR